MIWQEEEVVVHEAEVAHLVAVEAVAVELVSAEVEEAGPSGIATLVDHLAEEAGAIELRE